MLTYWALTRNPTRHHRTPPASSTRRGPLSMLRLALRNASTKRREDRPRLRVVVCGHAGHRRDISEAPRRKAGLTVVLAAGLLLQAVALYLLLRASAKVWRLRAEARRGRQEPPGDGERPSASCIGVCLTGHRLLQRRIPPARETQTQNAPMPSMASMAVRATPPPCSGGGQCCSWVFLRSQQRCSLGSPRRVCAAHRKSGRHLPRRPGQSPVVVTVQARGSAAGRC